MEELLRLAKLKKEQEIQAYLVRHQENIDLNKSIIPESRNGCENYILGYMYDKGLGVKRDYDESMRYMKLAAKQNSKLAANFLGDTI